MAGLTYRDAGVDLDAGAEAVARMKAALRSTFTPAVLSDVGAFGGLYDGGALAAMQAPVLVASTDGVGTKTCIAAALGDYTTVGRDLVNHCINDVLVQGARPLFFLDYIASSKLDPATVATVVAGCAAACREAGIALLGGETAELPGVYREGQLDLVGTLIGVVERHRIIDGRRIQPGDAALAVPSSGLHTNGFSLARRVFADHDLHAHVEALGEPLGAALLRPHRAYLPELEALQAAGIDVRGMAHITGGGLIDNPPRVLPAGLGLDLDPGAWTIPPIFRLIQQLGAIAPDELARVFNLGVGMLFYLPDDHLPAALDALGAEAFLAGRVVERDADAPRVHIAWEGAP